MSILKFKSDDRNYNSWCLYDASTLKIVNKELYNINPINDKLLNQDIFKINECGNVEMILHSSNREMEIIPGVIVFDKIYGKTKNNKYYFKVIPDDGRLPLFLAPYKVKHLGFEKKMNKKYIVFKFNNWDGKHPEAEIIHTIGDVNILPNFYEYQLYCKSLHSSIQNFTIKTKEILKQYSSDELIENIINYKEFNIEDRRMLDIISIDPKTSKDYDDAFGIKIIDEDENKYCLSIYISNVSIWFEFLGLWDSFTKRISTIYLPDRKRPMLPTILSDMLCSLQENQFRFALACDIIIKDNVIINYTFKNVVIKVKKNYYYNDINLDNDFTYNNTLNVIKKLNTNTDLKLCENITDSHDVVMFLMILMNYLTAQEFKKYENGIFRSIKLKHNNEIDDIDLPKEVKKFLMSWNSSGGQYLKYENYTSHELLKLDAYVHITSPIRRLVDLLNMIQLQHNTGIFKMSAKSETFLKYWVSNEMLDYINITMRSIRKVQTQCDLLDKCYNNPEIMEKKYEGFVFDKIKRNDALFQYLVYIPELKLLNKYTSRYERDNYSKNTYKLYLFEDEDTFKKKIMFNFEE
jgi:exoribonuclease R